MSETELYSSDKTNLENIIRLNLKASSKLRQYNAELRKDFDREKKRWDRELKRANTDSQQIRNNAVQLINEVERLKVEISNLTSQVSREQISHTEYKTKYNAQLKDIKSLQSIIKTLKDKLALTQKDSSTKDSEILSLKSELAELEIELTCLKSAATCNTKTLAQNLSDQVKSLSQEAEPRVSDPPAIVGGDTSTVEDFESQPATKQSSESPIPFSLKPYIINKKNAEKVNEVPQRSISNETITYNTQLNNGLDNSSPVKLHSQISAEGEIASIVSGTTASAIQSALPLLALIILALIVIIVTWFRYRRCRGRASLVGH
jgi:predicted RNase H-like nuclease (RuvC/YqgF family)